jgi:ribokinase
MDYNVVVVGQLARDLVLVVDEVPETGTSGPVRQRRELLGGKGANQAVSLAQLGMRPALVAVAGDDAVGDGLLDQARQDGIDVSAVVRRPGTATGLIVDLVDSQARWRYLEDLPGPVLLTEADVRAAEPAFAAARWVSVQLQQPAEAVMAAVQLAQEADARVILDGAPPGEHQRELLRAADVVRADAREAAMMAGTDINDADDARRAADVILGQGPGLVALAVGDTGNYFAWPGGDLLLPLTKTPVADTTGAGDAFTAALIASLAQGAAPDRAARLAVAAAGATVGHPGGRPSLTTEALDDQLALLGQP